MNKEEILVSVAIVLSFVISPIGIILGIIALRNENVKQNPGLKRFAIMAIVVGSLITIASIVALVYFQSATPDPSKYLPVRSQ